MKHSSLQNPLFCKKDDQLIVVEPITDRSLLHTFRKNGWKVESVDSLLSKYTPNLCTIILENFEAAEALDLMKRNFILIGPPFVRSEMENLLSGIRPCFSTYSLSLYNWKICFDSTISKDFVRQGRCLGCTVHDKLTKDVTCFITYKPTTPEFRRAASQNVPALQPHVLDIMWQFYRNADEPVDLSSKLISQYKIRCFENLYLAFTGCDTPEEQKTLTDLAVQNGARVCGISDKQVTHPITIRRRESPTVSTVYDLDWFYKSIKSGFPLPKNYSTPLKVAKKSSNTPLHNKANSNSTRNTPLQKSRKSSPHHLVSNGVKKLEPCVALDNLYQEIFEKETSYLVSLKDLCTMGEHFKAVLTRDTRERYKFFGKTVGRKIKSIYDLHYKIVEKTAQVEPNLRAIVYAQELHNNKLNIQRAYMAYVNITRDLGAEIKVLLESYPSLHDILSEFEKKWNKRRLQDLLILPVQRLCQISIMLDEAIKKLKKQQCDASVFEQALTSLSGILKTLNDVQNKVDKIESDLKRLQQIDRIPGHLLSTSHGSITDVAVMRILAYNFEYVADKKLIRFYLLDDTLILTKTTHREVSSTAKPLYIEHWKLSQIRVLHRISFFEKSECFALVFLIQANSQEQLFVFVAENDGECKQFVSALEKNICRTMPPSSRNVKSSFLLEVCFPQTCHEQYDIPAVLNILKKEGLIKLPARKNYPRQDDKLSQSFDNKLNTVHFLKSPLRRRESCASLPAYGTAEVCHPGFLKRTLSMIRSKFSRKKSGIQPSAEPPSENTTTNNVSVSADAKEKRDFFGSVYNILEDDAEHAIRKKTPRMH